MLSTLISYILSFFSPPHPIPYVVYIFLTSLRISCIHPSPLLLNISLFNRPIKKWREDLNNHFLKKEIDLVKRHTKKCSSLLITRKMQKKMTVRYHLRTVRLASIKVWKQVHVC